MAIFPVILCGGAGTRLWPASRPERPKQFLDLTSHLSLFQETVERVASLAGDTGRVVVVAGREHRGFVEAQLGGLDAVVLLEPAGRDSAAAMTAAAHWIRMADPQGVAVFVASDHHIPNGDGFRASVMEAIPSAQKGRIVVFGVRPTEPSSAYGYIRPERDGISPVASFVEKPDRDTAIDYVARGYLWNSGNLVVSASTLIQEIQSFAPDVATAVAASLPDSISRVIELTSAFEGAPRISMDYAVLERSSKVWVLPVDFGWSDLGAWDAVASTASAGRGLWIGGDGDGSNLVRAAEGMVVATAGVSNLAIIAEHDAVLVCDLSRSQEVKGLVERLREVSPGHFARATSETFETTAARFIDWIDLAALPLWGTLGVDTDGGFVESLDGRGKSTADFRRARVQARQAYVFAAAGLSGWSGPWAGLTAQGLDAFEAHNLRPDGLYRTRTDRHGSSLDDTPWLYDQAFVLFALAAAAEAGLRPVERLTKARSLIAAMEGLRHNTGGWREAGDLPFQANAHMHLLEACLAWEALDADGPWTRLADEIVEMARRSFIEPERGFLREFFSKDWTALSDDDGQIIEPGHQFEWVWLLTRWGRERRQEWALDAAQKLYAAGQKGVDPRMGIAVDALNTDLSIRSGHARLWPQTERLKAALILAETTEGADRDRFIRDAQSALHGLARYLEPSGLWRDKLGPDGKFVDEPSPASSLYHLMVASMQLRASMAKLTPAESQ